MSQNQMLSAQACKPCVVDKVWFHWAFNSKKKSVRTGLKVA